MTPSVITRVRNLPGVSRRTRRSKIRATWLGRPRAGTSAAVTGRRLAELRRPARFSRQLDVDPCLFGATREALLWLTGAPDAPDTVGAASPRHPDVAFAAATAGTTNLVVFIATHDDTTLYDDVLLEIGRIPGVRHIDLAPIARQVNRSGAMPLAATTS